ncbi:hypothetical protein [Desertibacillus haloalkaliphilus]|uniref:hypothetical protein n=1 Tax=Desertibacillus haloalkaliphilus TaxID=1328930 RepID=UPI001C270D2A|nr:hypothetical protein [Desertibacillus haloalkaliphilus]MBU8907089.1 hypothetical protein [Desertibacillus haloalkaliphilus]
MSFNDSYVTRDIEEVSIQNDQLKYGSTINHFSDLLESSSSSQRSGELVGYVDELEGWRAPMREASYDSRRKREGTDSL